MSHTQLVRGHTSRGTDSPASSQDNGTDLNDDKHNHSVYLFTEQQASTDASRPITRTTRVFANDDDAMRAKKERRKAQCRFNQANYRRRKRMGRLRVRDEIQSLEDEILALQSRLYDLQHGSVILDSYIKAYDIDKLLRPIERVAAFLIEFQQDRADLAQSPFELQHTCVDEAQAWAATHVEYMFDLQHQVFCTLKQLRLHWLWCRQHFDSFQLHLLSAHEYHADQDIIYVVSAELVAVRAAATTTTATAAALALGYDDTGKTQATTTDCASVRFHCPVRLSFAFDEATYAVNRIISDVEWVSGVSRASELSPTDALAKAQSLYCLLSTVGRVCQV